MGRFTPPAPINNKGMKDKIVTYKGEPALLMGHTSNGRATILRFRGRIIRAVENNEVKPYEGDKDAVTLGLKEPPRPLR